MAQRSTQEDFTLWLDGQRPLTDPDRSYTQISTLGHKDLVCSPIVQNIQALGATGIELYSDPKNHADAVGAILSFAAKKSHFTPGQSIDHQLDGFNSFLEKIQFFPGFCSIFNAESVQEKTSLDVETMITDLETLYSEVVKVERIELMDSLIGMANSIVNQSSKEVRPSVFVQVGLIQDDQDLLVTLFFTTVQMEYDDETDKKTFSPDCSYSVQRLVFKTMTEDLIQFADLLSEKIGNGSCGEFIVDFCSPGGDKESCFEAHYNAAAAAAGAKESSQGNGELSNAIALRPIPRFMLRKLQASKSEP